MAAALSPKERKALLELYAPLRVADVRDGLDWNGMLRIGSVSTSIRPVHRMRTCGIALTVRYLPFRGPLPRLTPEEYTEWSGMYYRDICPYPWMDALQSGDLAMIDQSGVDAGLMGSNNTLDGVRKGCRGYVTNGGVRDTDEIILQKIPFWSAFISQPMVQGRLAFDSFGQPVSVGGVQVRTGDVVVADGDGVVVVPLELAEAVAIRAAKELGGDKKARKAHYDALGLPPDPTVL
jgi:regulator of RNase E activity RraA